MGWSPEEHARPVDAILFVPSLLYGASTDANLASEVEEREEKGKKNRQNGGKGGNSEDMLKKELPLAARCNSY
jgi:hypothetical protein